MIVTDMETGYAVDDDLYLRLMGRFFFVDRADGDVVFNVSPIGKRSATSTVSCFARPTYPMTHFSLTLDFSLSFSLLDGSYWKALSEDAPSFDCHW